MTRRFRLLAGPNGSGKTTLKRRLERDYAVNFYDFLNADEIFAEVKESGAQAAGLPITVLRDGRVVRVGNGCPGRHGQGCRPAEMQDPGVRDE